MTPFYGYNIIIDRPKPKVRLSENVPVTDEFRAETNQWMIDRFGYQKGVVDDGQVIVIEISKTMVMSEPIYHKLMAAGKP